MEEGDPARSLAPRPQQVLGSFSDPELEGLDDLHGILRFEDPATRAPDWTFQPGNVLHLSSRAGHLLPSLGWVERDQKVCAEASDQAQILSQLPGTNSGAKRWR